MEDGLRGNFVTDSALGYFILRLCLGVNMLMHGVARIAAGPSAFAAGLEKQFAATFLAGWPVHLFGLALPWVEATLGVLLVTGALTRYALFSGGCLIAALTFGTCLTQQWEVAGSQLIYAFAFAVLLAWRSHNALSVDARFLQRNL